MIQNYIFQYDSKLYISIILKTIYCNMIQNCVFQLDSKLYNSMKFKYKIYKTPLYEAIEKAILKLLNFY